MECDSVRDLLNAFVDGELPAGDVALVEAHLENCPECRQLHDSARAQDASLRNALAGGRQAAAALVVRTAELIRQQPNPRQSWPRWASLVLSAAAGFLIAVGVFRPWQRPMQIIQLPPPIASNQQIQGQLSLVVAREPVDILPRGQSKWQTWRPGEAIDFGCRVRTKPDSRCEILTNDNSEIRLNGSTDLVIPSSRRLELAAGQIMARVSKNPAPFQVEVAATTITALGTEFDISCQPKETTLLVLEGSTSVVGKGQDAFVKSGEFARIVNGQITAKEQIDPMLMMLTTRWVNEILVMKGRENPELSKKIDDILAQLGRIKGEFLGEQEIRSLGDRCVLPLTRYLQSPRCEDANQREQRSMAARILSDLARPWSIPDLIQLLGHSDGAVRSQAARALQRLTGVNQGMTSDAWRGQQTEALNKGRQRWQAWWREHESNYRGIP